MVTPGSVEPDPLVAAEGAQAEFAAHRQVGGTDLVARKHDACKVDAELSGGGARRLEIGAKGLGTAAIFQAIEMRECMGADL